MGNYIDLHMHSLYSDDGDFSPEELGAQCRAAGMKIFSITDHNSVKANLEAEPYCKAQGMRYISGAEFDCSFQGIDLHCLGYGINPSFKPFHEWEEHVLAQGRKMASEKLRLTNTLGFHLKGEELEPLSFHGILTGEMFAEVLLGKAEYRDCDLLKPYRRGGERGDNPYVNFYWDFYSQGKPCYVESPRLDFSEIAALIHESGGAAVLAHPGKNLAGRYDLLDELIALGLDGIEVFSSYHTKENREYFYRRALEEKLLITAGSDYHGKTKPAIGIGDTGSEIDVDIEGQLKQYGLL